MPRQVEQQEAAVCAPFFLVHALSQQRSRQYVGLIYAARLGAQDGSVQQDKLKKVRGVTMSHFLLTQGLSAADIEMLCIVGIGIIPSIIGLALCCVSLRLPDDGYVLSKPRDDRQDGPQRVHDGGDDWRRAA
jgi:hypothetical protein